MVPFQEALLSKAPVPVGRTFNLHTIAFITQCYCTSEARDREPIGRLLFSPSSLQQRATRPCRFCRAARQWVPCSSACSFLSALASIMPGSTAQALLCLSWLRRRMHTRTHVHGLRRATPCTPVRLIILPDNGRRGGALYRRAPLSRNEKELIT